MKERHVLWSGIASRRGCDPKTANQKTALMRWNLVTISERFGWTPDYILSLPTDFLEDMMEICALRDYYNSKPRS